MSFYLCLYLILFLILFQYCEQHIDHKNFGRGHVQHVFWKPFFFIISKLFLEKKQQATQTHLSNIQFSAL